MLEKNPRVSWMLTCVAVLAVLAAPAWADPGATASSSPNPNPVPPGPEVAGTPGNVWDNGPSNSVNGLSSERATFTNGTGGPEGDHISTIANDFVITGVTELTEIRVCLYHNGTTAEMYLYTDGGGNPGPNVTSPIFGGPTTASVVSTTFTDQTSRCTAAFGYPGREYRFSPATTGVPFPVLQPGRYWLAVVGQGGSRAFWAQANSPVPSGPSFTGRWGSPIFGIPYWSDTATVGANQPEFAFDIDGRVISVIEIPTLSKVGLGLLVLLLATLTVVMLRRRAVR